MEIYPITLQQSDYTTDTLASIFKILGTFLEKICRGVIFTYSYRWQIEQLKLFKWGSVEGTVLGGTLQNF